MIDRFRPERLSPVLMLGVWGALLVSLVTLAPLGIFYAAAVMLALAAVLQGGLLFRLLRRTRWLLVMIVVLPGWLTPGMPVDWLPGASCDGLLFAADQSARILLCLAMVALLLGRMAPLRLIAGLYGSIRPLATLGSQGERLAVRLYLILESLQDGAAGAGRSQSSVVLPSHRWTAADSVVLAAMVVGIGWRFS